MMNEAERLQNQLVKQLDGAGFNPISPDVRVAWHTWKSFVEQLSAHEREGMGMAIEHFADRDDTLWLEFSIAVAEERGSRSIGLSFSRTVVSELVAVHKGLFFWADQETSLTEFWKQIEAEPSFERALALEKWITGTES